MNNALMSMYDIDHRKWETS